jgi:hypothetical protein
MESFFKFASESPFLTFFLALIILQAAIYIAKYMAYAIRGDPNIVRDDDEDDL